jgi:hypothetical protein
MNPKISLARHCERSVAIQRFDQVGISGLPRRCAPRNDDLFRVTPSDDLG